MDTTKRIPSGAIRTMAVWTFKEAGDYVKFWPDFKVLLEDYYKEEGMLDGEPFFQDGETAETATKLYVMATWKDEDALESHMKQPYVLRFFEVIKKFDIQIEITKFKSALA